MSTEIIARFYFDKGKPSPPEVLCQLARAFAAWPQASGHFEGLKVISGDLHTVSSRIEGRFSNESLCHLTSQIAFSSEDILSTVTSFRCWRFASGLPEPGSVAVIIEAWGETWARRNHEDNRLGGHAALSVMDCGPFCALVDTVENPSRDSINAKVEENLDALTGLFFRMIEALKPSSMKVFTDQGLYLPFNAHFAYYQDEARVLDDVALIADVWERGLPGHHIGPLKNHRPDDMGPAFHGWRNKSQQQNLWEELSTLLPYAHALTSDDVRQALVSGRFDTYDMPAGFTVLDYPHFINSFLDRFFIELLSLKNPGLQIKQKSV